MRYYTESGVTPPLGFLIAWLLGTIVFSILGFIYSFLIFVVPIIYLNFLISALYGASIGYSVKYFRLVGKIRNNRSRYVLLFFIFISAMYFQWAAYFSFVLESEDYVTAYMHNLFLIFNANEITSIIDLLYSYGSWEMFGAVVKGNTLLIVWILEAVVIFSTGALLLFKDKKIPFSEITDTWYPRYVLNYQFEHISAINRLVKDLEDNTLQTVSSLTYGQSYRYSNIYIFFIETENNQFLSIENVSIADRGKGKKNTKQILELLRLDNETARALMKAYGHKKAPPLSY